MSVAAGPIGRNAEVSAAVSSTKNAAVASMYSYSKTKGLFVGVSLEGSVILERKDANKIFYHRAVTAKEILKGDVERPTEICAELYAALDAYSDGMDIASPAVSPSDMKGAAQPPAYTDGTKPLIPPRPSGAGTQSVMAIALYDYTGQRAEDLTFKKGEIIEVTKRTASQNDWWTGRIQSR